MAIGPGVRALGIAESARGEESSTLAGAVVRRDRVVDGLAFGTCTISGLDATDAVRTLLDRLAREDVRTLLLAGVALAWYNVLDLEAIAAHADRPTVSVSFEESEGLTPALERAFSGEALSTRLERYRSLPPRYEHHVNGERVYLRSVGIEREGARAVVDAYTPVGGRPEPLRVARMAARAGDAHTERRKGKG